MTGGNLITGDGQIEYNGLLLGDDIATFCDSITGWDDLPDITTMGSERAMYHGSFPGRSFVRARNITWSGKLNTVDPSDFPGAVAALRAALAPNTSETDQPIYVRTHDETLVCYGSIARRSIPNSRMFGSARIADIAVQFLCSDPRKYSLTNTTLSTAFPSAVSDGLDYPITYPIDYGAVTTTGNISFNNQGDAPLPAVYTITGDCVNPIIYNDTTGETVTFIISLGVGETLTVDTEAGTVLLNGVTDRLYTRKTNSSPLLSLEIIPGVNSIRAHGASWGASATLTVTAASAAYF